MSFDWKSIIKGIAPTLATALGGPLAGAAVSKLGSVLLGKDNAKEEEIAAALATASPEMLLKLKEAEIAFSKQMGDLGIDLEKLEVQDRDSARQRQVAMKDWTPNILGVILLAGYFGIQIFLLIHGVPTTGADIILRSLGTLDAITMTVVAFFFGSSTGSRAKDAALNKAIERK